MTAPSSNSKKPAAKKPPQRSKKANAIARAAELRRQANELLDEVERMEGRPPLYRDEYAARATDLCLLGLTNEELADRFGVDLKSIERWLVDVPAFRGAVYAGREGADAEIARAMFSAARGYSHAEDDIKVVALGNNQGSEIVITPTVKHYPPNYNMANLWMLNRQKRRWPNRESNAAGMGEGGKSPADVARAARAAIDAALRELDAPTPAADEGSTTTGEA